MRWPDWLVCGCRRVFQGRRWRLDVGVENAKGGLRKIEGMWWSDN